MIAVLDWRKWRRLSAVFMVRCVPMVTYFAWNSLLLTSAWMNACMMKPLSCACFHAEIPLLQLGLPDATVDHGDPGELLAACGLDAAGIVKSVRERFGHRRPEAVRKPAA